MTEEEKNGIKYLEDLIESFYTFPNPQSVLIKDSEVGNLETLLNLIQKQQAELEKKDKMIDKMLDMIVRVHHSEDPKIEFIANANIEEKKEQVKRYLEKQVEKE